MTFKPRGGLWQIQRLLKMSDYSKHVRFHERHWNTGWFMMRFPLRLVGMKLIPKNPINGETVGWGSFCEFWKGVFWAGQDQDWKMHRFYFNPPQSSIAPEKSFQDYTYTFLLGRPIPIFRGRSSRCSTTRWTSHDRNLSGSEAVKGFDFPKAFKDGTSYQSVNRDLSVPAKNELPKWWTSENQNPGTQSNQTFNQTQNPS